MTMTFFVPLFLSCCFLFPLRQIAIKTQLVDIPTLRKQHEGEIPLIGGLITFTAMLCSYLYLIKFDRFVMDNQLALYFLGAGCFVCIGAMDDKYQLNAKVRLIIQSLIALWVVTSAHVQLMTLGHLFSDVDVTLPPSLTYLVSILAICAAVNAFNMIDGLDGLLGGITLIIISALGVLFLTQQHANPFLICVLISGAILPSLFFNLGWPLGLRGKIFLGDAGSMLMGFTVIWLLLTGSQSETPAFRPVTALWLIALPLMDMVALIIRRIFRGHSPFQADRQHIHHLCMNYGWSSSKTVLVLVGFSGITAGIGVVGEAEQLNETGLFIGFLMTFCLYFGLTLRLSKRQDMHKKMPDLSLNTVLSSHASPLNDTLTKTGDKTVVPFPYHRLNKDSTQTRYKHKQNIKK